MTALALTLLAALIGHVAGRALWERVVAGWWR